jgi:hypothetical protein
VESPNPQSSELTDVCRVRQYQCSKVLLPSIDEVQTTYEILDLSEKEFLLELLEYQVFLQALSNIRASTGLTNEEIITQAIALFEVVEEANKQGKKMRII